MAKSPTTEAEMETVADFTLSEYDTNWSKREFVYSAKESGDYYAGLYVYSNADQNWVNIDNEIGIVSTATGNSIAFGDRELNSSIYLSKIYPAYSRIARTFSNGDIVARRHLIYYCNVDSATTAQLASQAHPLTAQVPKGWNGIIASDPDSVHYLLLSNYAGESSCTLKDIMMQEGAPVFTEMTAISPQGSTVTFRCDTCHSVANALRIFIQGGQLEARQM